MVKRWQLILGLGVLIGAAITYVALQAAPSGRFVRMRVLRKVDDRTMEVLVMFRMP